MTLDLETGNWVRAIKHVSPWEKVGKYDDDACVHNTARNEMDFPVCCGRTRLNVSQAVSANISGDLTHVLTAD